MTDNPTFNRRRVLELTGVGTGVAVAGCMNQVGGDGEGRQVAVSLQVDDSDVQRRQRELQQEVLSGNTSRQEAAQEIQTLQAEAVADAVDTAEDVFASSDITIEDQLDGQALLLISGTDADILDSLETDVVQAIAAAGLFEQAQEQQQQQQQQQQPTNDTPADDTEPANETAAE